mmetsp:Transcript_16848/g.46263  ORF Transcript_16848/g.46263 Transcript_16848/m.46263 type:complete len:507 (-) Transcript_16848:793-2313(-)
MEVSDAPGRGRVTAALPQDPSRVIGAVKDVHDEGVGSSSGRYQQGFLGQILQLADAARVVGPLDFAQNGASLPRVVEVVVTILIIVVVAGRGEVPHGDGSVGTTHRERCDPVLECRSVRPETHARDAHRLFAVRWFGLVSERKEQLVAPEIDQVDDSLGVPGGDGINGGRCFQRRDLGLCGRSVLVQAFEGVDDLSGSNVEQDHGVPRGFGARTTYNDLVDVGGWVHGDAGTKGGEFLERDAFVHRQGGPGRHQQDDLSPAGILAATRLVGGLRTLVLRVVVAVAVIVAAVLVLFSHHGDAIGAVVVGLSLAQHDRDQCRVLLFVLLLPGHGHFDFSQVQHVRDRPILATATAVTVERFAQVIERGDRLRPLKERDPLGSSLRRKSVRHYRDAQGVVRHDARDFLRSPIFGFGIGLRDARECVAHHHRMEPVALHEVEAFPNGGADHGVRRVLVGDEVKGTVGNDSQGSVRRKEPRVSPACRRSSAGHGGFGGRRSIVVVDAALFG